MEEKIDFEENYEKIKNLILIDDIANNLLGLELMQHFQTHPKIISLLLALAVLRATDNTVRELIQKRLKEFLPAEQQQLLTKHIESYLQNFYANGSHNELYEDFLVMMEKFDFLDFKELANTLLIINHRLLAYCIKKQTDTLINLMRLAEVRESDGTVLALQDCNLKQVPPEIGEFQDLYYLNISRNPIKELPDEMAKLKNLRYLYYDETPLYKRTLKKLEKWFPVLMADKYNDYHVLKNFRGDDGTLKSGLSFDEIEATLAWIDKCIHLDANNATYRNTKGVILDSLDRYKEAEACFEEALRLDLDAPLTYSNKAYNLVLQNRLQDSLEVAQKGLEIISNKTQTNSFLEASLYFRVGQALYHLKRYEESEANYLKATQIAPQDGSSFYNLACIYAIWQQHDKVIQFLKTAIELNEQYFEEAKLDTDFEAYWEDIKFWEALKSE